jgi:hypothetical protein
VADLAQAVETDTGTALGRSKARTLGQAVETDTARTLHKARGIGQAVETDTATVLRQTSFTAVTLTGEFDTPGGAAAKGWLRLTLSEPMRNGALIRAAAPVTVFLNGSGAITTTLTATDDPATETDSGDEPTYLVEELLVGQRPRSYRIALTRADTTQDLADLTPEN